ncbi:hypothetical protein [Frankia sp. R82]|uniref:hypothetical protein n=1 Tax=Frankia sp. R82 TaxID=2950553 RepID=UPI002044C195|nr:hypothetical protein [Frankia sp. R82]MCM3883458.1 hypothetical protein [Frankia sp. R82]
MPGARPTSRRQAVGGFHSHGRSSAATPTVAPAGPLRSPRAARPLVRRAAGLVLGLAVLLPVATAVNDGHDGHPGSPPPVAAGVAQH